MLQADNVQSITEELEVDEYIIRIVQGYGGFGFIVTAQYHARYRDSQ